MEIGHYPQTAASPLPRAHQNQPGPTPGNGIPLHGKNRDALKETETSNVTPSESTTYTAKGTIAESPSNTNEVPPEEESKSPDDATESRSDQTGNPKDPSELSETEAREVDKLKARDAEVKSHERAHVAAGGQYVTKAASFEYETGPDGKRYAVGGEVSISISKVPNDPEATIAKMQTVKRAALAPANPSSQDRTVAAKASRIEMEARAEASFSSISDGEKNDVPGKSNNDENDAIPGLPPEYANRNETTGKGIRLDISI